eukprot:403366189
MSADSQLVLYVHLIPQTTQLIQQTIKVKLDENSVVADLRRAVSEQLDKHNDGNKIYTVRAIYSSDPQSDNTALESIPLKRVLGSFFESGSDVFCLVDIQVDVQRHVKPIEVKKAQTSTTNAKPTQQDIGGIFTTDKFITLTKYSFYESGKNWVKVLLDLKDIKTLDKNQIKIEFGKRSFTLHIYDFKGKNYSFSVPKLQCYILSEQSTMVIKNDSIQINLRKAKEDDNWWSLFRSKAVGEVDSD